MQIGIPREIYPEECRVAVTPEVVSHLTELGFTVKLETNAGKAASFSDAESAICTMREAATTVTSEPGRTTDALPIGVTEPLRATGPLFQ